MCTMLLCELHVVRDTLPSQEAALDFTALAQRISWSWSLGPRRSPRVLTWARSTPRCICALPLLRLKAADTLTRQQRQALAIRFLSRRVAHCSVVHAGTRVVKPAKHLQMRLGHLPIGFLLACNDGLRGNTLACDCEYAKGPKHPH